MYLTAQGGERNHSRKDEQLPRGKAKVIARSRSQDTANSKSKKRRQQGKVLEVRKYAYL
jgi:hypothetical protein